MKFNATARRGSPFFPQMRAKMAGKLTAFTRGVLTGRELNHFLL
jgi:hypothetical protein